MLQTNNEHIFSVCIFFTSNNILFKKISQKNFMSSIPKISTEPFICKHKLKVKNNIFMTFSNVFCPQK